ncbi:ComEC/Rec2 family competence protein [Kocuria palustris]|uniref:ComEC/Rec2 family competence protein n=1 Tax=Kocuria palustris TaxID=71999 RepID=UPI001642DB24|nr:ComEC/Rec2 family competence protein [Kocuria palustris]
MRAQAQKREDRLEAARRAPRPTWDLRLVPVAISAWGAAVTGAVQPGIVDAALEVLIRRPVLPAGVLAMLLAALVIRTAGRGRPGRRAAGTRTASRRRPRGARPPQRSVASIARDVLPTVLLCALIVAAVVLRTGAQQATTAQEMRGLGAGAERVTLEVVDRPVEWHSTPDSAFGPAPEQTGEAASGVVVPVRLDSGAEAALFAEDPRWAAVRTGERYDAVVGSSQGLAAELRLCSSSPPSPAVTQRKPSPLGTATQRFALAASARGPDAAGLLPGMTYGDRGGLDQALEKAMKVTGLTHLTAVSGSNCALVMALAGRLALGLGLRRRMCLLAGLAALGLFVALVGPDPSVLRAAVMGSVAALAVLSGRGPVSLAALSTAMCALLVIDPSLGSEYGFALSVCATAGIVVTGRAMTRVLERALPPVLALAVAIPLVAQLWCGPVMAMLTPTVATYAVPANALAAPVVPLVTVIGLAALVLLGIGGPVGTWLGQLLLHPGSWCAGLIARTARFFAGLPGSTAPWLPPPMGPVLMLVLSAVLVVAVHRLDARWLRHAVSGEAAGTAPGPVDERAWLRARRRERLWRSAAVAAAAVGAVALVAVLRWPGPTDEDWSVLACDVGQGDAVLVRGREAGKETTVLIDAGPEPEAVRTCLADAGVDHLDLLVLTHDHADHVAGAAGLGAVVRIDEVWWSSATGRAPDELADLGAAGRRPAVDELYTGAGLTLRVLGPDPARAAISPESEDENNASLVLRAEVADGRDRFSMLAAGDLEESGAGPVLRGEPTLLDVDLLKVSHHGARNGGTALIDAASPGLALVSVGEDNDYGHPHPSIIQHLGRAGVPVARTDQHGAAAIRREEGALVAVPLG